LDYKRRRTVIYSILISVLAICHYVCKTNFLRFCLLDTAVPINILDFTSLDSVNLPSVTCPVEAVY